jgi:hypothetical protein
LTGAAECSRRQTPPPAPQWVSTVLAALHGNRPGQCALRARARFTLTINVFLFEAALGRFQVTANHYRWS